MRDGGGGGVNIHANCGNDMGNGRNDGSSGRGMVVMVVVTLETLWEEIIRGRWRLEGEKSRGRITTLPSKDALSTELKIIYFHF